MVVPSALFVLPDAVAGLLSDANGNVRGAMICWAIALSAFIILRVPRKVLLGCLAAAAATVGIAVTIIDATPVQATVSSAVSPRSQAYRPLPRSALPDEGASRY